MKKMVIKGIVSAAVFFISLFAVSAVMNKGNTDMTMEMSPATFPLVYMNSEEEKFNCLRGYVGEMNGSSLRETITPLMDGRRLSVFIEKMGNEIEGLSFEVRSVDGQRLVENTVVYNYEEDSEEIRAVFAVKDLIEENVEYNLILFLETKDGKMLRYYTRIIQAPEYFGEQKLDFVKNFHERSFDKEAAKSLTMYMESNEEGDNSSYSYVNIHSSFQQITWGDLDVSVVEEPVYYLREIGPSTANFNVSYLVKIPEGREENYYTVTEFYRIRYTTERTYLLDYERKMRQLFREDDTAFINNKIMLGINSQDIELMESDGGNVFAFVNENKLYSYNISDNKFAVLFGFYDEENRDRRTLYNAHEIKILNVDETENVQFLVYGYMNRGRHEGQTGLQVCYYNSMLNTIEEAVFIPDNRSYEMIKADVEQLSYVNKDNSLYVLLAGSVYEINLESKNYKTIVSDLKEGGYQISESNRMLAWESGEEEEYNEELTLMNLNSKKQTKILADRGEMIAPLGFMEEDLIYGTAKKADVEKDRGGKVLVPLYRIEIQNENDEVLKTYSQPGVYVVSASIEDNLINLKRVERNEETMQYVPIEDDQIMNNEEAAVGENRIETAVTGEYETIVQIAVKSNIDKRTLKFLTPREVLFEGGRDVHIVPEETDTEHYYVYARDGIDGIYTDPGNAINRAAELSGVVIGDRGEYIWISGNRNIKNQIMAIEADASNEERGSLAVCLDTILNYEGIPRNTAYMLEHGNTALSILENNLPEAHILELSGCSLDSVLYYVNRDIPILAMLNDQNAVLIIGFNELNTVLMDPLTGEIYKKGMNDSKEWFEENGNSFITYVR